MPLASLNGLRLYYEEAGTGDPVVLIGGLGADAHFWYKQVPALARHFRVISFDNRDSNRSDRVETAYTAADMAGDVRGLLDALELAGAHVIAASLGGFIGQEFALAYPERVRRLVLCCTSFGGAMAAPIPQATLQAMRSRTGDPERDLRAFLPLQIASNYLETHAAEVDEYVAWRAAHPQELPAYQRQLGAAATHDTESRLSRLAMPVLILHGVHDRVVPSRNAELLAARIPGARLRLFPDAGHLFLWEAADEANHVIIEFLAGSEI